MAIPEVQELGNEYFYYYKRYLGFSSFINNNQLDRLADPWQS